MASGPTNIPSLEAPWYFRLLLWHFHIIHRIWWNLQNVEGKKMIGTDAGKIQQISQAVPKVKGKKEFSQKFTTYLIAYFWNPGIISTLWQVCIIIWDFPPRFCSNYLPSYHCRCTISTSIKTDKRKKIKWKKRKEKMAGKGKRRQDKRT